MRRKSSRVARRKVVPAYRLAKRCLGAPKIPSLSLTDSRQVGAALGWLELGNPKEARAELEELSPESLTHPEVLRAEYLVCEALLDWHAAIEVASNICQLFPKSVYGWNQLAYALHQVKRTAEAYELLLPVCSDFPSEAAIPYNLACYSCQLGKTEEAWRWLEKSLLLGGRQEIKAQALADSDLQPLWPQISEL